VERDLIVVVQGHLGDVPEIPGAALVIHDLQDGRCSAVDFGTPAEVATVLTQ